jgi:hypothetical protein
MALQPMHEMGWNGIDPDDTDPSLEADEPDSVSAEFTPRVRLTHRNLSRAQLKLLIDNAPDNALKVRVTGTRRPPSVKIDYERWPPFVCL